MNYGLKMLRSVVVMNGAPCNPVTAGITMQVNDVQFLNAPPQIIVTESGLITFTREAHPLKVSSLISVILFGITMDVRDVHPINE